MTTKNPAGGLLDLIERHRNGRKNTELAAASGGLVNAPALGSLIHNGLRTFPKASSLRGYSRALGVPLADVVLAAAVSLGLDPEDLGAGSSDDLVIAGAGRLPEGSRRLLRDMADNMLRWMEEVEQASVDVSARNVTAVPWGEPDDPHEPIPLDSAADAQVEPTGSDVTNREMDAAGEESQERPDDA